METLILDANKKFTFLFIFLKYKLPLSISIKNCNSYFFFYNFTNLIKFVALFFQNEVSASKGISPAAPSNFKPVIKKSVTYIVAAVLVNEHGDVLMMQVGQLTSIKSSCHSFSLFEFVIFKSMWLNGS